MPIPLPDRATERRRGNPIRRGLWMCLRKEKNKGMETAGPRPVSGAAAVTIPGTRIFTSGKSRDVARGIYPSTTEEAARRALIEARYSLQQSTVDLASKDITAPHSMSQ